MAMRKGRSVTAREKPVYQACAAAMLRGDIYAWTADSPTEYRMWYSAEQFGTVEDRKAGRDGGETVSTAVLAERFGLVTTKARRATGPGKAELMKLVRRITEEVNKVENGYAGFVLSAETRAEVERVLTAA